MNVLEETWRNLQELIGDRENELEKESRRQDLNDELRQLFAEKANSFHRFVADTRFVLLLRTHFPFPMDTFRNDKNLIF